MFPEVIEPPGELERPVSLPKKKLFVPLVTSSPALYPTAVLEPPVVFSNAWNPTATNSEALVASIPASLPIITF